MRIGEVGVPQQVRVPRGEVDGAGTHGRAAAPHEAASTDEPSPFAKVLRNLGKQVDQGEKAVHRAVDGGGKDLGPSELLALQAGVYRYSEAVDLTAKLIDRATSGVKTVLQGQ
ncbi:MAG: hypothetical protein JWP97_3116 [Labilithrix sp.]|nr:hypothetical protein [Labilithrix sp.]